MLLRILVITLLVVLAIRFATRVALELARRAAPPPPPPPNRAPRHLVACPVCGDYFEEHRGLALPAERAPDGTPLEVCSEECRARRDRSAGGTR